jgi:sugar-specific transcriptional regulator TrmB
MNAYENMEQTDQIKTMGKFIGLSDNEIEVYSCLVRRERMTALDISKETSIYRTNVYDILDSLEKKGIISHIMINNKMYFMASDVKNLLDYMDDQKRQLDEKKKQLSQMIEKLKISPKEAKEETNIGVFKGKKALKFMCEDILRENKDFHVIGYSGKTAQVLDFNWDNWDKRRAKLGLRRYALAKPIARTILQKSPLTTIRYLSEPFESKVSTTVYGNKVFIRLHDKDETSFMINNEGFKDYFMEIFNRLWKISSKS